MPNVERDFQRTQSKAVHYGPHPGIVALVFMLLFVASLLIIKIMTNSAPFPIPYGPVETSKRYFIQFAQAVRIGSFFQFGAAIPLGIFTAAVTSRLKFLGVTVTGVSIALFGGIASS